jgi:hypothetical protein
MLDHSLIVTACSTILLLGCPSTAFADECGNKTPDYTAHRTITIGNDVKQITVYISGEQIREEADNGKVITLRFPIKGDTYVFRPDDKEGIHFKAPAKPPQLTLRTRVVSDIQPNGNTLKHNQIFGDDKWQDVSTTTCRADNVMLSEQFIVVDPNKQMVRGSAQQTEISIHPLSTDLFRVPSSVNIVEPPNKSE